MAIDISRHNGASVALPGDLSSELNWAAVLLGGLWALSYGAWRWFGVYVCVRAGSLLLWTLSWPYVAAWPWGYVFALCSFTEVCTWALRAALGCSANGLAWRRMQSEQPSSLLSTESRWSEYRRVQSTLTVLGGLTLGAGYTVGILKATSVAGWSDPRVWSTAWGVVALIALLVYERVRKAAGDD